MAIYKGTKIFKGKKYDEYKIEKGDSLSLIFKKLGYKNWRTIWFSIYHDEINKDFRKRFPNPNVIDYINSKSFYIPARPQPPTKIKKSLPTLEYLYWLIRSKSNQFSKENISRYSPQDLTDEDIEILMTIKGEQGYLDRFYPELGKAFKELMQDYSLTTGQIVSLMYLREEIYKRTKTEYMVKITTAFIPWIARIAAPMYFPKLIANATRLLSIIVEKKSEKEKSEYTKDYFKKELRKILKSK